MTTPRHSILALTAALALGVTACGSGDEPADATTTTTTSEATTSRSSSSSSAPASSTSSSTSTTSSSAAEDLDAVLAAIAAAEKKAGGTAYEIDDQDDDGTWEVDVAKGSKSIEVDVDARGRATIDERDDLDDDDRAALKAAKITLGDAIETALGEVDGTFDDAELETEGKVHVWEVTVDVADDEREVHVDVRSGKVVDEPGDD